MGSDWWLVPISVVFGVLVIWAALLAAMWFAKPNEIEVRDALRLLPDLLRLLKRLALPGVLHRRH